MAKLITDEDIRLNLIINGGNESQKKLLDLEKSTRSLTRSNKYLKEARTRLVKEGKNDKAEDIIDLALEKMPIKYFGYYIFTEPFIDGYFKIGKTEKALATYNQVKGKYLEYLDYYKSVPLSEQSNALEEIYGYLEKYKSLTELLDANGQKELFEKEVTVFQGYVEQFQHLFSGIEE